MASSSSSASEDRYRKVVQAVLGTAPGDSGQSGSSGPSGPATNANAKSKSTTSGVPIESTAERGKIFQFKITLKNTKPPIWRRIQVPGRYSFRQLNKAIQAAMGWADYHLHSFQLANSALSIGIKQSSGSEGLWGFEPEQLDEKKHYIYQYFSLENSLGTKKAKYDYDFGDFWQHNILLEAVIDPKPDTSYPICMAGKRACPPEDVSGIHGFYEFLDKLKDPNHPEHEDMKEWGEGQGFDVDEDPEGAHFDPDKVSFFIMEGDGDEGWLF